MLEQPSEDQQKPTSRTAVQVSHFQTLKFEGEPSTCTLCEPLSSLTGTWCRMQNVHYHVTVATIHHRTFRVNWTLHRMSPSAAAQKVCFYWQNRIFRIRISFQKLNLRVTYSFPIKKMIYMRENVLPPKIVDSEHVRVRRDKANTLRIKRDSILD